MTGPHGTAPRGTVAEQPVATRPSGWPVLRTPRWMLGGAAVLAAGLALAAITLRPTNGQRAADLRAMTHQLTVDIESCAGGVTDSLAALQGIQSGASHDVALAVKIANTAAANCSPANNMQLEDLVQYQVPQSLASFHLDTTVNDLVTWAFPDAQRVQADVAALITAHGSAAVASATARLHADRAALDAQRATIERALASASAELGAHIPPLPLPS